MRTTLEIDDDVWCAAKEIAAKERKTAGKIVSELFRRGLQMEAHSGAQDGQPYALKNGIPVLASRGDVVTTAHIQKIMEQEGL